MRSSPVALARAARRLGDVLVCDLGTCEPSCHTRPAGTRQGHVGAIPGGAPASAGRAVRQPWGGARPAQNSTSRLHFRATSEVSSLSPKSTPKPAVTVVPSSSSSPLPLPLPGPLLFPLGSLRLAIL